MFTRGFELESLTDCFYRSAVAARRGPDSYDVTVIENGAALPGTNAGMSGLTLRQALDCLDEWERTQSVNGLPYDLAYEKRPNFRDVATDFGVTPGLEGASLRHAAGVKRLKRLIHKNKPRR